MNQELYHKYAELAVKIGVNLQKGQEVIVRASLNSAPFVREIVEQAYLNGAKRVSVDWSDEFINRCYYQYADEETICEIRQWELEKMAHRCKVLPCRIYVDDADPNAFDGLDMDKILKERMVRYTSFKKYTDEIENKEQWTIIAVPSAAWAKKMFPNDSEEEAVQKLWDAIIKCTRLEGDPIANWEEHIAYLKEKSKKMNDYNFDYLTYRSANGTNLKLHLQKNHEWLSAREKSLQGYEFSANMPTEEVFTMPAKYGADGVVVSTKPLSYQGNLIEDFKITFEKGKAVAVEAKTGQQVLEKMISLDEGSAYLGEVALVGFDSPINQTGYLFYNTLFDENACCHLALGMAFKNNIKGYETMSEEDFKAVDFNDSANHVDFMIGSEDLSIIGTTFDGTEVEVFKDGKWAI